MEEWYQATSEQDTKEKIIPFRNRKHVHVHKVAMLLSLAERDDLILSMTHFKAAVALLDNVELKLPGVFAGMGKNIFGGEMESIRDFIHKQPGKVEFKRIHRRFYQDIPGEAKIKELLGELITLGLVEKSRNEQGTKTFYEYKEQS